MLNIKLKVYTLNLYHYGNAMLLGIECMNTYQIYSKPNPYFVISNRPYLYFLCCTKHTVWPMSNVQLLNDDIILVLAHPVMAS